MADHARSESPAVQAQLDRLAALSPGRDVLGLERIAELCTRLGNPQDRLPRTFHVWPHGKYEADEAKLAAFKPDAYQAKMAKWMFKHMSMNASATLEEETARYLEAVAWETWQEVKQTLLSAP